MHIVLYATVLLAAPACEVGGRGADRAGNAPEPTVVVIATEEIHATPTLLLELLADRVLELSDGSVRLEVRRGPGGGLAWDQETIRLADDGQADGVLVRAGSWRDFGVTSLDLLQLPGVIETDDQADRLITDRVVVDRLLAGIDRTGFTQLGLFPEAPRYLMLLDGSTDFSLESLAGKAVRTPLSATVFDLLESLGMRPVDIAPQDFASAVSAGEVPATDGHLERVLLTVTADGAAYYERTLRLLSDLDDIEASMTNARASPMGRLRVDVGTSVAQLQQILDAYQTPLSPELLTLRSLAFEHRLFERQHSVQRHNVTKLAITCLQRLPTDGANSLRRVEIISPTSRMTTHFLHLTAKNAAQLLFTQGFE